MLIKFLQKRWLQSNRVEVAESVVKRLGGPPPWAPRLHGPTVRGARNLVAKQVEMGFKAGEYDDD